MSFLADEGVPLHAVEVSDAGSQFRSRDVFPGVLAALTRGRVDLLGERVTVGPAPVRAVVYTDGYGNLKTSWYTPPAPEGTSVRVRIGAVVQEVVVSDGVFAVPAGAIAFAPGSSGWPRGDGKGTRVSYEIFARDRNAAELFGVPATGTSVELLT
jgi:hypothetical protein